MRREARALAIDIGGSKTAVAAVRGDGEIVSATSRPTESQRGFAAGLARICEDARGVLAAAGWRASELDGIGIGCAGPVDPVGGTIENDYTLPGFKGGAIVAGLEREFSCPAVLENDADAALLGECQAGAGRGRDPVVMLTFGTGIGGAALVAGGLLRGAGGEHPELGHLPVDPAGPPCYCGANGCLEALASGTALGAAAAAHGMGDARSLLARAAAGDETALRLRARALAATACATRAILHALLPERIVLGGGMMDEHYEPFARTVEEQLARAPLVPAGRVSVARAELGSRAGLVGAAGALFARLANRERQHRARPA